MIKLVLGTAQFGMNYGVNNKKGMVPEAEVHSILEYAIRNGIDTVDTAYAYGEAEFVLGRFFEKRPDEFKVITKASGDRATIESSMAVSMKRLRVNKLYGFMLHSFGDFVAHPDLRNSFAVMSSLGKSSKVGFSFYYPSELDTAIEMGVRFDIAQVPYSIFDQRFAAHLPRLKEMGVEVHVRSVFLQGLYFKDPSTLPGSLGIARDKLALLDKLAARARIAKEALCLCFAVSNPCADKAVIGVDGLEHLVKNIDALGLQDKILSMREDLLRMSETNEDIVVPSRWAASRST